MNVCKSHSQVIEMALFQKNTGKKASGGLCRVQFNLNASESVCFV